MSGFSHYSIQMDEVDQSMESRLCGAVFIDQHTDVLIERACTVEPILDKLLTAKVITAEQYQDIITEKTPHRQMRQLLTGPMKSSGDRGKQILYNILKEQQALMMADLGAV